MILTDEELLTAICGHIPPQNIDNVVVKDIIKDGRAIESAVAAAVAKRCIALVIAEDVAPSDFAPGVQECIANAIRREFGEAGNG